MLKSLRELPEEMRSIIRHVTKFEGLIGFIDFYRYEGSTLMGKGYFVFDSMDRINGNKDLIYLFSLGTCYMMDHNGIDEMCFGGLTGGTTWKPFDVYEDKRDPDYTMRKMNLYELLEEVQ